MHILNGLQLYQHYQQLQLQMVLLKHWAKLESLSSGCQAFS